MPKSTGVDQHLPPKSTLTPSQQRILKVLEKSNRPLSPKEIAFLLKMKHQTVRKYLSELYKKGLVKRIAYGLYQQVLTNCREVLEGRQQSPWAPFQEKSHLEIHDLILTYEDPIICDLPSLSYEINAGEISIKIRFGKKNGKVTAWIVKGNSESNGMTYNEFCLASKIFLLEIRRVLGLNDKEMEELPDRIMLKRVNINNDFDGLEIDGAKSITLRTFDGALKRIYQKGKKVRIEVQPSSKSKITLSQALALLQGGAGAYNALTIVATVAKKLDKLIELEENNSRQQGLIIRLIQELLKREMRPL